LFDVTVQGEGWSDGVYTPALIPHAPQSTVRVKRNQKTHSAIVPVRAILAGTGANANCYTAHVKHGLFDPISNGSDYRYATVMLGPPTDDFELTQLHWAKSLDGKSFEPLDPAFVGLYYGSDANDDLYARCARRGIYLYAKCSTALGPLLDRLSLGFKVSYALETSPRSFEDSFEDNRISKEGLAQGFIALKLEHKQLKKLSGSSLPAELRVRCKSFTAHFYNPHDDGLIGTKVTAKQNKAAYGVKLLKEE